MSWRMNTVHPATLMAFKRWMSTQPERKAMKRRRGALQEVFEKYPPQICVKNRPVAPVGYAQTAIKYVAKVIQKYGYEPYCGAMA